MKKISLLLVIIILSPFFLLAQMPKTLNFQGVLTDPATGQAVADATYTFDFAIFNVSTAGASLWTETQSIATEDGLYNAVLGTLTPLNIAFDVPYWLEVTVAAEVLSPRIELTAPAYTLDDDIEDLADGTLSGSKVGTGINGANINDATITSAKISGTIAIADGGTNATTAAVARTSLGLAIGTNVQAYDADLKDLADGTLSGSKVGTGISGSNVTTGTITDVRLESTVDRTIFRASDYITALGGVHVGGTTDPGTDNLVVDGNVGIGTTSAETKLEVSLATSATTPLVQIENTSTGDASLLFDSGNDFTIGVDNSDGDKFKISDATFLGSLDRLVIDGSGYVGINTNLPKRGLHLGGSSVYNTSIAFHNTASTGNWNIGHSNNSIYYTYITDDFATYGSDIFQMTSTSFWTRTNANLGSAGYKWGTVYATNGTINTSDRRLKNNVTGLKYGLFEVLQLTPVTYKWNNKTIDNKTHLGLIAQGVQKIIPEIISVADNEEQTLSLSYTELIPVTIKAIQEQQEIIDAQAKEIYELKEALAKQLASTNQLKSKNSMLESKVDDLATSIQKIEELLNLKVSKK